MVIDVRDRNLVKKIEEMKELPYIDHSDEGKFTTYVFKDKYFPKPVNFTIVSAGPLPLNRSMDKHISHYHIPDFKKGRGMLFYKEDYDFLESPEFWQIVSADYSTKDPQFLWSYKGFLFTTRRL